MTTKEDEEVRMKQIEWCCVPVIVDDGIPELFQMPMPDDDPDQQPVFRVTQSTADLVPVDFGIYKPSLQRMVDNWRAEKERVLQDSRAQTQTEAA